MGHGAPFFKDRLHAGRLLAQKLLAYRTQSPLILALPRGGVPVGAQVAKVLHARLDTLVARKIGAPYNPEFGLGAIAPKNVVIFDESSLRLLGLRREDLSSTIDREKKEMERRIRFYRSGEYSKGFPAETVIMVDDGLATGVTARVALESARRKYHPKKLVFATPVCAADAASQLEYIADEVVCANQVENLLAIGRWYQEFNQTTDQEVIECLREANEGQ